MFTIIMKTNLSEDLEFSGRDTYRSDRTMLKVIFWRRILNDPKMVKQIHLSATILSKNNYNSVPTVHVHQCHCRGRHDCGSNSKVKVSIGRTGVPNLSGRQWKLGVKARVALEANSTITETADLCDRCSSKI